MEELQQKIAQAIQSDFIGDVIFYYEEIKQMKTDFASFIAHHNKVGQNYRSEDIDKLIQSS